MMLKKALLYGLLFCVVMMLVGGVSAQSAPIAEDFYIDGDFTIHVTAPGIALAPGSRYPLADQKPAMQVLLEQRAHTLAYAFNCVGRYSKHVVGPIKVDAVRYVSSYRGEDGLTYGRFTGNVLVNCAIDPATHESVDTDADYRDVTTTLNPTGLVDAVDSAFRAGTANFLWHSNDKNGHERHKYLGNWPNWSQPSSGDGKFYGVFSFKMGEREYNLPDGHLEGILTAFGCTGVNFSGTYPYDCEAENQDLTEYTETGYAIRSSCLFACTRDPRTHASVSDDGIDIPPKFIGELISEFPDTGWVKDTKYLNSALNTAPDTNVVWQYDGKFYAGHFDRDTPVPPLCTLTCTPPQELDPVACACRLNCPLGCPAGQVMSPGSCDCVCENSCMGGGIPNPDNACACEDQVCPEPVTPCQEHCTEWFVRSLDLECQEGRWDASVDVCACVDDCPLDPNKGVPGVCGCGVADEDLDLNGVIDCNQPEPICPTVLCTEPKTVLNKDTCTCECPAGEMLSPDGTLCVPPIPPLNQGCCIGNECVDARTLVACSTPCSLKGPNTCGGGDDVERSFIGVVVTEVPGGLDDETKQAVALYRLKYIAKLFDCVLTGVLPGTTSLLNRFHDEVDGITTAESWHLACAIDPTTHANIDDLDLPAASTDIYNLFNAYDEPDPRNRNMIWNHLRAGRTAYTGGYFPGYFAWDVEPEPVPCTPDEIDYFEGQFVMELPRGLTEEQRQTEASRRMRYLAKHYNCVPLGDDFEDYDVMTDTRIDPELPAYPDPVAWTGRIRCAPNPKGDSSIFNGIVIPVTSRTPNQRAILRYNTGEYSFAYDATGHYGYATAEPDINVIWNDIISPVSGYSESGSTYYTAYIDWDSLDWENLPEPLPIPGDCPETDLCPEDPDKTAPGVCGCGTPDQDGDGDRVMDCEDACPADAAKVTPGDCGCDTPDPTSTDCAKCVDGTNTASALVCRDGIKIGQEFVREFCQCECPVGMPDPRYIPLCQEDCAGVENCIEGVWNYTRCQRFCEDLCPADPEKGVPGACGCGVAETGDSDGDGTYDCNDLCPQSRAKTAPGVCGCNVSDNDHDQDGTPDCHDLCRDDPAKTAPGACGCGRPDTDSDSDGIADCVDTCPSINPRTYICPTPGDRLNEKTCTCETPPPVRSCVDPDAKDGSLMYQRGTSLQVKPTPLRPYNDYCRVDGKLAEQVCQSRSEPGAPVVYDCKTLNRKFSCLKDKKTGFGYCGADAGIIPLPKPVPTPTPKPKLPVPRGPTPSF
ncbi:MAG: hypothetical protein HQM16_14395 [Deltaproteobacteria bacterium]|nr:hypothetical protein [Deltaproteobacteria bacterium]